MKIVVDAMGGDYAPGVVIEGAVEAVKEFDLEVILTGKEDIIKSHLAKFKYPESKISIVHASEVIEMGEQAALTVRRKRDSSIVVGIELVKEKKADAFFSAGNTGAVVCAATLSLRLLEGIERPGIAIILPTSKGPSLIIDVGANIDSKPNHLLQYAIMGSAYFKDILRKENPTVGILNIGEEETKGTEFIKETHALLGKSRLNFAGNVEAKKIFSGDCNVVVCDGFVGNITLKVSEGLSEAIMAFLKKHLNNGLFSKLGLLFLKGNFKDFKKELDYSEYGGAPLLGVDGIVIIGHGHSSAKAIKNAIRVAKEEVERGINDDIVEEMRRLQ